MVSAILLDGHFNARTGQTNIGSVNNFYHVRRNATENSRQFQDKITQDLGHSLISLSLSFDLAILNGRVDTENV